MSTMHQPGRPSLQRLLFDYLERIRRLEAVPVRGHYQIKVFADDNALDGNVPDSAKIVVVGDGKFIFAIPDDLNLAFLWDCFAYVTTVGASVITIQLRNITQSQDMLSTRITIDGGEFTSYTGVPHVINTSNAQVLEGDLISIDIDTGGGGTAKGLGVGLEFSPPAAA